MNGIARARANERPSYNYPNELEFELQFEYHIDIMHRSYEQHEHNKYIHIY